MPIWALAYLALYGVFSLAGMADDRRSGRHAAYLLMGLLALICEALLIVAFFHHEIAESVGGIAIPLFATSVGFATWSAAVDLVELAAHQDLPDEERAVLPAAIVTNLLIYAPAAILGWLVVLRSLSVGD